jgi:DNA polymerase IV
VIPIRRKAEDLPASALAWHPPAMTLPARRIAHLDMDAFYASVELLRYADLRGLPVVVGGRRAVAGTPQGESCPRFPRLREYAGRGVVTTSTYEARALGVFSGMGLMKAAQLAPEAILLPADFDAYRHYSRLFKAAVATIAPRIEDRGIDEIYIDLSDIPGETRDLALRIKRAVREATGLSCSIGITPNKLLSKIASDLEKPDGLTLLAPEDLPTRIWPLPVRKINGIGPKATQKLGELGIATIGQLAHAPLGFLQAHFGGRTGTWLHEAAHGIDERPVVTHSEPKSVSRETTFERDLHPRHDREELSALFTNLCVRLAEDLRRKGYVGRTIGIKLRYADFRTVTRDLTLLEPSADAAVIRRAAGECLRRLSLDQKLRLLGVRASGLSVPDPGSPADPPRQAELPFALPT